MRLLCIRLGRGGVGCLVSDLSRILSMMIGMEMWFFGFDKSCLG